MKKLLFISVLLLAFGCSKEDEASEQSEQTFLEKYDGVAFEGSTIDGKKLFWFFYNSDIFLEEVTEGGNDCNRASEGENYDNPKTKWRSSTDFRFVVKIVENNSTTLRVQFGDLTGNNEYMNSIREFSVDQTGQTLTFKSYNGLGNEMNYNAVGPFTKSDAKYSDYCN